MRQMYAKITFRFILLSFLALMLIGCGESGTPGGSTGPGVTASITLNAAATSLPADGKTSVTISASLVDSVGAAVLERTSVVFRTNLGKFRNGASEYKVKTADASGSVIVQLISGSAPGTAEVWAESNNVKQKVEVKFYDPDKVGNITLRTGSASITADGSSQVAITATVTNAQGNPEEGATVNFKTTLGQFLEAANLLLPGIINQQTTAITDVDGEARVVLVSGTTIGTANILASLDGLNATASVIFTAGEPQTISMRAAPSTIRPNGTSNVFAKLSDINGNPVEGQTIVFSQLVNASEGTLSPLSVETNVNGEAQATYTAGKDPGSNVIQAALSSDLNMKTTTTIVVDPSAIVIGEITVTAGSTSLVADGTSKVKIRATVTDVDGNVAVGKTVNFITTAGFLTPASSKTSNIGLAESMLQSTTIAGPVTVRAECDGFIADVKVEFVPGPADHILMFALPDVVPPNGQFRTSAIIMDKYNNRIDDQRLTFLVRKIGDPTVINSLEMTPDQAENGVYNYTWTASYVLYGLDDIEITARVNNGVSKTVLVQIDEDAAIVGSISVSAGATAIEADGHSSVTVRALVLDHTGAPAQGIMVDFSTTLGTLSAAQKKTDQNGYAEVKLTSGTVWGTATVRADANGFIGQVQVLFTTGKAGGLHVTMMPSLVKPGEQATVIAELRDSNGAPVANELLYFDIYENRTLASLSAIQATTDSNGRATVTYTAGAYLYDMCAGDNICSTQDCIRVTLASDSSITETTCIRVAIPTGSVGYITLTSAANSLPADGTSSTAVTATAFDTAGIAMPEGTSITFSTTLGTFPGGIDPDGLGPVTSQIILKTIDDTGKIITSLISGTVGGLAQITATCAGVSQMLNIIINDGSVAVGSIVLTANPTSIPADGASSSAITAVVKDTTGNPVPIGTPVAFTTNLGLFANGFQSIVVNTTNATGTVTTSLISGLDNGEAWVTATVGSMTQLIKITFEEGGATTTAEMIIDVSKRVIDATGSSSSEIKVLLRDEDHNPIKGATINFSTTLGTVTGTAITGADGYAYIKDTTNYPVLISAKQNGIATVKAWYGPKSSPYASAQTDVEFTGVTITVTADPDSLSTSENTTVKATLKGPSGDPLADQEIILETSLGKFTVITTGTVTGDTHFSARTDSSGNVSVKLSSSSGGTALVTGWHAPTKGMPGETSDSKEVIFTGKKLTISPAEDALVANGVDSTAVVLKLEDESGNPVANQEILLSTSLGHIDASVVTDALGEATATLTAGTVIGVAKLTAVAELAGGAKITVTAEVSFISGNVASITLVADPSIIQINTGVSNIRAMVRDSNGNPVYGVNVAFTIIDAPGGGETITPVTARTGSAQSGIPGQATASFKAGSLGSTTINDVIIEASIGAIVASASLTITSNASHISLGACTTKECLTDNGDGSYSIPVSAVVSDVNGIAVPAGVAVTFSVGNAELGTIVSPVSTNDQGRASTTLTYPASQAGNDIQIIASTAGVEEDVMIKLPSFQTDAIADIFLSSPASILGDGASSIELRAQAVDNNGNAVVASVFFNNSVTSDFTGANAGNFIDYNYLGLGDTRVNFIANPGADENNDPTDGFVSQNYDAFLRAYSGTVIKSDTNKIVVKGITLTVEPENATLLANGISTTKVTAVLKETATGLPIANKELNFGVTNGVISGSATTNGSGAAQVTFTSIKSDVDKTASIRCYYGSDIMASTEINLVTSAVVGSIWASTDKNTLDNDPSETATITAQVLDANGNPVVDGQLVTFEITSGPGQVQASATTTNGIATAIFRATPDIGVSQIRVSSGGMDTTIEIQIVEGGNVGSITLTPGSGSIVANGTSTTLIRAIVKDLEGNPAAGIAVDFTTTLGTIVGGPTVFTTANGVADVTLRSTATTGTATVTATAGGFSDSADIVFMAGAPNSMLLTAAPSTVHPSNTSILIATLRDINLNPISGETISFNLITNASGASLSAVSAVTDVNGQATIEYTAGTTQPVTDRVRARSVTDTTITDYVDIAVNQSATVVQSVTVVAGASSLVANGTSTTLIRATVRDTDGNVVSGKTVNFTTTAGILTPASSATNASGLADSMLRSTTTAGPVTVRAECDGFIAEVQVEFIPGPADHILMRAIPDVVPPNGLFDISAIVMDQYNNRIDDQRLILQLRVVGNPTVVNSAELTPDQAENGVYRSTGWMARFGTTDLEMTAKVNNGVSQTVIIDVDENAIVVGSVTVTSGATSLVANGVSTTLIRATVRDADGNLASGVSVDFATTLGALVGATTVTTNTSGVAQVTLRSITAIGTATVTADANGFTASVDVAFVPGAPNSMLLTAEPSTVNTTKLSTLTATLRDINGNPLSGETISFGFNTNASGASLSAASAVTNVNGQATITYTSGTAQPATDRVRARSVKDTTITDYVDIVVGATSVVGEITLTSTKASIPADNVSSTGITARITDTTGAPVPLGTSVTFTTTLGRFSNGLQTLTRQTASATGVVSVTLIAGNTGGVATVTATCNDVSQALYIVIDDGSVVVGSIVLTANPTSIPADGTSSSSITAVVRNTSGVAVPLGTPVVFTTSLGTFSNGFASIAVNTTNTTGTVTTSLMAPTTSGIATVTATSGGVSQTTQVTIRSTEIPIAASLSLTTTKTSIKANGTDAATVTALVLDENNAPIEGATVNFTSTGGQISASSVVTNVNGQGAITFTSGPDKFNHTVMITANVDAQTASIPITLYGTEITITPATAQIYFTQNKQIIVTAVDADFIPIFNAAITITNATPGFTDFTLTRNGSPVTLPATFNTDYAGRVVLSLTAGNTSGTLEIKAAGLDTSFTAIYAIGDPADIFRITAPSPSPYSSSADGTQVAVTVHAGGMTTGDILALTTTFGTWTGYTTKTIYIPITAPDQDITRSISATQAGVATIQAYDLNDPTVFDFAQISFFNPASKAYSIVLDASQTNILPSTGTTQYSLIIKAKVYDINNNPVQGAMVDFYLENTTGGGEYLSPVAAMTNSAGYAQTTFTSGTLGTGGDPGSAVIVHARVATPAACTPEVTTITCAADVGGSLSGDYFTLYKWNYIAYLLPTQTNYYVWYDVNNGSTDPALVDRTGIEVNIATGATNSQVASATAAAINAVAGFDASVLANVVSVTTCGDVPNSANFATGFTITTTTEGTGVAYKEDTIAIVITGAIANVSIGYASQISANGNNTLYLLPVSVLVADTNGNPVSGAVVSLSLRPSEFSTGYWYNDVVDGWTVIFDNPYFGTNDYPDAGIPNVFINEDLNGNSILDGDEDEVTSYYPGDPDLPGYFPGYNPTNYTVPVLPTDPPLYGAIPGLGDGLLTPGQSVAGTIPSSVTTEENGVASFTLTYQKEYGIWVQDQITATCMVFGTEYITKSRRWLPISASEKETIATAFPASPFNNLPEGIVP